MAPLYKAQLWLIITTAHLLVYFTTIQQVDPDSDTLCSSFQMPGLLFHSQISQVSVRLISGDPLGLNH